MDYQKVYNRRMQAQRAAMGMGWFSIGLGLAELLLARPMSRWMGMRDQEDVVRFYGVRELATGIGLLASKDPTPWMWGRVAGDALDIATLAAQFEGNPRKGALMTALVAVAGATAADVLTAQQLTRQKKAARPAVRDYSMRTGYPLGQDAVRGIAMKDFSTPREYRTSDGSRSAPGAVHSPLSQRFASSREAKLRVVTPRLMPTVSKKATMGSPTRPTRAILKRAMPESTAWSPWATAIA
jgi:hypothetical protein